MMSRTIKIAVISLIIILSTCGIFGTGIAVGESGLLFQPNVVRAEDQPPEFATFWQAWSLVHKYFVDRSALDTKLLTYGAIRGMVAALGDQGHTVFLTPEEVARSKANISGVYTGIGAQLGLEKGLPVIVAPFDGSPAQKAGVKAGDIIIEVDHQDVSTWSLNDVVEHVRGEAGTQVELTVIRPDANKSLEVTITRGEIDAPTATWVMVPGTQVALIRLSQFSANATDEMQTAIREAEAAGATGLIIDVRNNPGGLLEQAVNVTSQFLKDGNVLQQEDAQGQRKAYAVKPDGIATDIPLVVLINRGSASAAEIFAGAIQDHQRGKLVGETTFGTGTVLEPFPLDDGSALMLGTSQWLTANGRLIRKHGIEPDVEIKLPIETNLLSPQELKGLSATEVMNSEDTQLLKALELLTATP